MEYAAYVSRPIGSVIAVSTVRSAIPGSRLIGPKPVSRPMPTHPPQMETKAGRESRNSGHAKGERWSPALRLKIFMGFSCLDRF